MEAIALIVIYLILTVGVLIGIWRTLKARGPKPKPDALDRIPPRKPADPEDSALFRISMAVILIAGAYVMLVPDSRAAEAPQKPQRIVLNLADCPAQGEDSLPLVMFIVTTRSDTGHFSSTCARIQKRNYKPATLRKPARPVSTKE